MARRIVLGVEGLEGRTLLSLLYSLRPTNPSTRSDSRSN